MRFLKDTIDKIIPGVLFKGLITIGRDLPQLHQRYFLSDAGMYRVYHIEINVASIFCDTHRDSATIVKHVATHCFVL